MQAPLKATLLRIFVGEGDRHGSQPLYEAIVLKAREAGLAGATVLRAPMGFGQSSRLHTAKLLRLSEDLSFVVEIVDRTDKMNDFLPILDVLFTESGGSGLVTMEGVEVLHYGKKPL